jgi:AraC family transcriptional regulator
MLTYSLRTNIGLRARFAENTSFDRSDSRLSPNPVLALGQCSELTGVEDRHNKRLWQFPDCHTKQLINNAVDIFPSGSVHRRAITWDGMAVELVQTTAYDKVEFRFRAPYHLLIAYEQGVRRNGETLVEGLPRSMLRDFKGRLTLVPAGCEFREWQEARIASRVTYFYFDPAKMPAVPEDASLPTTPLAPRLFFEDRELWETAVKLTALMQGGSENRRYCEALGTVLAHELVRLSTGKRPIGPPLRGGLAAWQQRTVTNYIEEHLAEQIPLATLSQLVRLSPYYFCRAFKQSFGIPPHRYHTQRRIERAKALLRETRDSVTAIALTLGFSETSSFTVAFRKTTGSTPTGFRRREA